MNKNTKAYYTGAYVTDVADLYASSLVSGLHSVAIGPPGSGKTDIAISMLKEIYGDSYWSMARIHPGTQPEEIEGPADMEVLLKDSRLERKVEGTPFDPSNRAVLIDEIGRANRVLVGLLMFLLDQKSHHAPPVLATSNFMPTSIEAEALLDRISLWMHVDVGHFDPRAMVAAQMSGTNGFLSVPGKLPTKEAIEFVWNAQPGTKAINAVSDVLETVAGDAVAEGFSVHPRRLFQWQRLLYRTSVWLTEKADFSSVPAESVAYLRFAMPSKTSEEWARWTDLVGVSGDPAGAIIERVMAEGIGKMNKLADMHVDVRMAEVGAALQDLQSELKTVGEDPRVEEAIAESSSWFALLARGEKIHRGI